MESVTESRVEKRKKATCPNCSGTVIEPRSSDMWNCAKCARQWNKSELGL